MPGRGSADAAHSPTLTSPATTQHGHDPRHRRLHGARAGARQAGRQARRHLGVRRGAVRDADGRAALPRRDRLRHAGRGAAAGHPVERVCRRTRRRRSGGCSSGCSSAIRGSGCATSATRSSRSTDVLRGRASRASRRSRRRPWAARGSARACRGCIAAIAVAAAMATVAVRQQPRRRRTAPGVSSRRSPTRRARKARRAFRPTAARSRTPRARTARGTSTCSASAGARRPPVAGGSRVVTRRPPAFSPDGRRSRSTSRDGDGGIFVAGATGESSRRLTDVGFHPAWSPGWRQIAFTPRSSTIPTSRAGESQLWVVDAAGGAPRRIDGGGDIAQPSWSPSGRRIVFWEQHGRPARYLFHPRGRRRPRAPRRRTRRSTGRRAGRPTGRAVLFERSAAARRISGGSASTKPRDGPSGPPEAVTAGVLAAEQPSMSKDGTRLAFRSRLSAINPVSIPFDPDTGRAGTPTILSSANTTLFPNDISPDGRWLALFRWRPESARPLHQRHRRVGPPKPDGGSRPGPLAGMDRRRQEAAVLFEPRRDMGSMDDRPGRRQSSEGRRRARAERYLSATLILRAIAWSIGRSNREVFITDVAANAAPRLLPNTSVDGASLTVTTWSRDGARLAGPFHRRERQPGRHRRLRFGRAEAREGERRPDRRARAGSPTAAASFTSRWAGSSWCSTRSR